MKRTVCRLGKLTLTLAFVVGLLSGLAAQSHLADGSRVIRRNRLMSARIDPGSRLQLGPAKPGPLRMRIDGLADEPEWKEAASPGGFSSSATAFETTSVRVLSDGEAVYLFWQVAEPDGVTATLTEEDGIIIPDDYVQVDLKPWLPDEIQHARDYLYSVAVNPKGVVWDAYFDPYLDGYFFSWWDSGAVVATTEGAESWTVEMRIPYAGLDHSSDPGWIWGLGFAHAAVGPSGSVISAPFQGVTVRQQTMVRREPLVSYYWTRPEFMQEVKPPERTSSDRIGLLPLEDAPRIDGAFDVSLWKNVPVLPIAVADRSGLPLRTAVARARVGISSERLCFFLEADGAKTAPPVEPSQRLGEGMGAQTEAVNGVFVDPALFADESVWVMIQPRGRDADTIHQPSYLILVNNRGMVRGTAYDRFGRPDHGWTPQVAVDLFDTPSGWGVELTVPLAELEVPVESSSSWGLNFFRNRVAAEGSGGTSELQAWLYTATDFLNPAKFGLLGGLPRNMPTALRTRLLAHAHELEARIKSAAGEKGQELADRLARLKPAIADDPLAALKEMEAIDQRLGALEALAEYASRPHPAEGGYGIFDLQFIGQYGWAVGPMGTVLRTEDGGDRWEAVKLGHDADLHRVRFVDTREGWAVGGRIRMGATNEAMRHDERGGYGYIFHTVDGGRTWECQYGERGRLLFGLDFLNRKLGYACGELGILLRTEDGGTTWQEWTTTGTSNWLYGLRFVDESNGWAVGESETLLRTGDGGRSWTALRAPADRKFYGFRSAYRDIDFAGRNGCIVGQNGVVVVSADGGDTWKPAGTFLDSQVRELLDLTRIRFSNSARAYAVGELGSRLLVTEDGGVSWSLRPVPNRDWLRSVWADGDARVIVGGERERILVSGDSGRSWKGARGSQPNADLLVMLAHGDDAAISLGALYAHYGAGEGRSIVDISVMRDAHSVEYKGETYNLEHHRTMYLSGVRTTTYFDEFENGNNGSDYYHFTERLWEGEENVVRHMVAAIRAYRPAVMIVHDGVYGDYDKPGHKLSGRAGLLAFDSSGGEVDQWPELTRLGLAPWQSKKLYVLAGESYPATLSLQALADAPLAGTKGNCLDWAEFVIRNFQSQGVYHSEAGELSLVKTLVPVPSPEKSIFDGLN